MLSISDERKLEPEVVEKLFRRIQEEQILLFSPRVFLCVLIGIMIPQVASSSAQNPKKDMLALLIFVIFVFIHIDYESYIIESKYLIHGLDSPNDWSFNTNLILEVSITFLVSVMFVVVVTSERIRKVVVHKIPVLLSPAGSVASWEEIEDQAVRSWITARTSQPQYIIARSILTSSTSFIVTLCVGLYIAEWFKMRHVPSLPYMIVLVSQASVILLGWLIVCRRCITAVVYYPRGMEDLRTYFRLEDFWTRASLEDVKHTTAYSVVIISKKCLTYSVVIISKICWLIAQLVFSNRYMGRLVMPLDCDQISDLYNSPGNDVDFNKFSPAIMHMPGENPKGLWIANRKSVQKAKEWMRKGEDDAIPLRLLKNKTSQVLSYTDPSALEVQSGFSVGKRTAKITVVSLLTVLIELFASGGSSAHPNTNTIVTNCIIDCKKAWKIMELVEKKDPGAALVNKVADRLFDSLTKKSHMWLGLSLPSKDFVPGTVIEAKCRLSTLMEKVSTLIEKEDCRRIGRSTIGYDSVNWTALGLTLLENENSLADVIRNCVMKVKERIIEECRLEADADMEEEEQKLWKVFEVAGMAKEILTMAELDGPLTAAEQNV